ncbi:MAG: diguanylate cyclase [Candidatus Omnitrophica bacterium]|nr:diguanylate cyclase [Candidatus Omnitrophota bacterium]
MRLTLQSRIINMMIVSSVLLVSAFTFIQVNNQVQNISRYNSYQANLSTVLVKNNLQAMLKGAAAEDVPGFLRVAIASLAEAEITNHLIVYDKDGKIIASSNNQVGETVSFKDLSKADDLKSLLSQNKWYFSSIDRLKHQLNIYVALTEQPGILGYVAKISLPLASIGEALNQVYIPVIIAILVVIAANIILSYILSRTVVGPIKMLNEVTKIIAAGDLAVRTDIHTEDEIEELGATFNYMAGELVKMKERAENANPLTKLPGNIVIHEQIDKRINSKEKFMVIYCDLDNFKAFNDKYGIAKGDEAIKLTSEVFKESVKVKGGPDDFLGHEGGDDFLLLTTPDRAEGVAEYITSEFDKRVRSLYSEEDLKAGKIIAHARDGSIKEFPIMTISLAGVTNAHRPIISYVEVTNIAAEIKKKSKAIPGSSFVVDKRKD